MFVAKKTWRFRSLKQSQITVNMTLEGKCYLSQKYNNNCPLLRGIDKIVNIFNSS